MAWWIIAIAVLGVALIIFCRPGAIPKKIPLSAAETVSYKSVNVQAALPSATGNRVLVTGGSGFLASTIVDMLLLQGEKDITLFDIAPCSKYTGDNRVRFVKGDVTKPEDVTAACSGMDVVYHVAAILCFHHRLKFQYKRAFMINVLGTENVIQACIEAGVTRLVYTSTSNVAVEPSQPSLLDLDETTPYVVNPTSFYGKTKAIAEKRVLEANGSITKRGPLHVVTLRPTSLIFGLGDRTCVDAALASMKHTMMCPDRTVDYVYVENVAYAHVLAAEKLRVGAAGVAGQAFAITNGPSGAITDGQFLHILQTYIPNMKAMVLPYALLLLLAYVSETVTRWSRGRMKLGMLELLTPPTVRFSSLSYTFTDTKSRTVLGYQPLFTVSQAVEKISQLRSQK